MQLPKGLQAFLKEQYVFFCKAFTEVRDVQFQTEYMSVFPAKFAPV
ncbi:MAG: hypothetical protein PHV51_08900 [Methanosarcinaceae archaeon]|nr:hypothetical protein [Methanosarcinaceae archaeon]